MHLVGPYYTNISSCTVHTHTHTHTQICHQTTKLLLCNVLFLLLAYSEVLPGLITPLSQSVTVRSTDLAIRYQLPFGPGYYYSSNVVTASHHVFVNVLNVCKCSLQNPSATGFLLFVTLPFFITVYNHVCYVPDTFLAV